MTKICQNCGQVRATEKHHKFSQSKVNRSLYGQLLHEDINIQYLCYGCHHDKPLLKWNEIEFCEALGIKPRSKVLNPRGVR